MTILWPYLLLAGGFLLLVKGADWLVAGASELARRLRISDLAIGLTVVAFGTSLPELFVNTAASLAGSTGIAIGNVVGSNIANILLILGVSALIRPLRVGRGTVWREIPFSLLAAAALGILANDHLLDGWFYSDISRSDGLVCLLFFSIFLYYSAAVAREGGGLEAAAPRKRGEAGRSVLLMALGLAGLCLGGHWIVGGAMQIARSLGMSESLVGLSIVALGTSLPELAASAMAAWRNNLEIAVGNIVGSNIFNIFFVLGVSAVIRPLPFDRSVNLDIGMAVFAGLVLFLTMFSGRRQCLDRWEAALLVCLYAAYMVLRIWMPFS